MAIKKRAAHSFASVAVRWDLNLTTTSYFATIMSSFRVSFLVAFRNDCPLLQSPLNINQDIGLNGNLK